MIGWDKHAFGTGAIGPNSLFLVLLVPTMGDEQLPDQAGAVAITHSISLSFNGGKPVLIPSQFIVKDLGFLRKMFQKSYRPAVQNTTFHLWP